MEPARAFLSVAVVMSMLADFVKRSLVVSFEMSD